MDANSVFSILTYDKFETSIFTLFKVILIYMDYIFFYELNMSLIKYNLRENSIPFHNHSS